MCSKKRENCHEFQYYIHISTCELAYIASKAVTNTKPYLSTAQVQQLTTIVIGVHSVNGKIYIREVGGGYHKIKINITG